MSLSFLIIKTGRVACSIRFVGRCCEAVLLWRYLPMFNKCVLSFLIAAQETNDYTKHLIPTTLRSGLGGELLPLGGLLARWARFRVARLNIWNTLILRVTRCVFDLLNLATLRVGHKPRGRELWKQLAKSQAFGWFNRIHSNWWKFSLETCSSNIMTNPWNLCQTRLISAVYPKLKKPACVLGNTASSQPEFLCHSIFVCGLTCNKGQITLSICMLDRDQLLHCPPLFFFFSGLKNF